MNRTNVIPFPHHLDDGRSVVIYAEMDGHKFLGAEMFDFPDEDNELDFEALPFKQRKEIMDRAIKIASGKELEP